MKRRQCFINDSDRCRLGMLLSSREGRAWGDSRRVHNLDVHLEDAQAISSNETPSDLVTMNSTVELRDLQSGAAQRVRLVYPSDHDLASNCVSIFEPLGTQLLGSQVGDVVCRENNAARVTKIVFQPEQAGAWHL
jgi:regulator of nucleoside diphosphate kinase